MKEAIDFTKECRELRKKGATDEQWEYATKLDEACKTIDQQAAQLKAKDELLFAFESVRAPKQLPARELTAKMRRIYMPTDPRVSIPIEWEYILKLCDRLDRSETSRKELLTACKNIRKIYIEGSGNTSWMANYSDMEAAIKANKQGD